MAIFVADLHDRYAMCHKSPDGDDVGGGGDYLHEMVSYFPRNRALRRKVPRVWTVQRSIAFDKDRSLQ